jgi:hypothetical protein
MLGWATGDAGRWGTDYVARKKEIMSKKIKRFFSRNKKRKSIKTWPKEFNIGENEKPLLATMTGEPFQLARIHYDLSCKKTIECVFTEMKCMDFDQNLNRWVWNYHAEAKKIKFKSSYNDIPKQHRPIVIGSFYLPTEQHMYLDVNSFDRTVEAIKFFDKHISCKVARLSHVQVVNKLFEAVPGEIPSQNDFFDSDHPEKPDGKSSLDEIAADSSLSKSEKMVLAQKNMDENLRKPMKEIESIPLHFYEEGIDSFDGALKMRHVIAVEHWSGNPAFSFHDIFQKMFLGS